MQFNQVFSKKNASESSGSFKPNLISPMRRQTTIIKRDASFDQALKRKSSVKLKQSFGHIALSPQDSNPIEIHEEF